MTVGLVIVSHSAQLAAGVVELARQMTQGQTPLAAAGGGPDDILGTSADKILEAIQQVESPDGVLLLLDLGSAILSAEMALEMYDSAEPAEIALSYAPLVEGCVAAALEASLGRSLAQVKQAAEKTASVQHLKQLKPLDDVEAEEIPASSPAEPLAEPAASLEVQLILHNPAGLHARPASLFVQTAARFQAEIQVLATTKNRQANAVSIMDVLGLGARQGDTIIVRASGREAQAALDALSTLVQANFYETSLPAETREQTKQVATPDASQPQQAQERTVSQASHASWHGTRTSSGAAIGPALRYTGSTLSLQAVPTHTIAESQIADEQEQLRSTLHATAQELNRLAKEVRRNVGEDEGGIFEAQALMLQDPKLHTIAQRLISEQHLSAVSALAQAGEQQAQTLEQLDNTLLAARAIDVRDAVGRALRKLGVQADSPQDLTNLSQPVILLANDLTPSDTAQLTPEQVIGICTTQGGPTAHSAIIARTLGIPAISGLSETALQTIHDGDELGLDADHGLLYHQPASDIRDQLNQRIAAQQNARARQQQSAWQAQGPLMVQGRHIHLLANIGSEAEASNARRWGAEGVGLLRTEFLFGGSATLPNEEEQFQRYQQVFRAFLGEGTTADKPIVVRTLDAGADKPFPALEAAIGLQKEANPALGLRGVRIHLAHEDLLEIQLSALLRAASATSTELHIMFPMITTLEELRSARAVFDRAYKKLQQQKVKLPAHIPVGIMVEVPAAALMAHELAQQADFFSIGANDLLQYTLACDRTNSTVSYLYDPLQPAVLRLIQQIAAAGCQAGKPVAVCGEIASDVRLAPILVGMGVDELSMTPTALGAVREVLSKSTASSIDELVQKAVHASTVAEVGQACDQFLATQAG